MQWANQDHVANDLLALLELQLQIEQIDAGRIAGASVERLKRYNKVLGEQLGGLKEEIEGIELRFCTTSGFKPGRFAVDPAQAGPTARAAPLATAPGTEPTAAIERWLKQQRRLLSEPPPFPFY